MEGDDHRTNDRFWNRIPRFLRKRIAHLNRRSSNTDDNIQAEPDPAPEDAATSTSTTTSNSRSGGELIKDRATNEKTKQTRNSRKMCLHNMKKVTIIHDGHPALERKTLDRHSKKDRVTIHSGNDVPQIIPSVSAVVEEKDCAATGSSNACPTPTEQRVGRSIFLRDTSRSHGEEIWDARVNTCQSDTIPEKPQLENTTG